MSYQDRYDRLAEIRARLDETRAYEDQHGVLYDAPLPDPNDIAWLLDEVDRLNAEIQDRKWKTRRLLAQLHRPD